MNNHYSRRCFSLWFKILTLILLVFPLFSPPYSVFAQPKTDIIWTQEKDEALRHFMIQWERSMGQHYVSYTPNTPGYHFDLEIRMPQAFIEYSYMPDDPASIGWSEFTRMPRHYHVVANYVDTQNDHFYLFTVIDGFPTVLYSNSQKRNSRGVFIFTPTQNTDLQQNFERIAWGQSTSYSYTTRSPLWNEYKSQRLREFMANWEIGMGQTYLEHTPSYPGNFHGVSVPLRAVEMFALGQHRVPAIWAPEGNIANIHNIVACYLEYPQPNHNAPFVNLYLFAIVDGEPIVYNSRQTQGGLPENGLYFQTTQNVDLANGFTRIFYE